MKKIRFLRNEYNKEKELMICDSNSFPLSRKNELIECLNKEWFNEVLVDVDNETFSLDKAYFLHIHIDKIGTFHFVFKDEININEIKGKLILLKDIKPKNDEEETKKVVSMLDIVKKYNPVFVYLLCDYKGIDTLPFKEFDFPFIYLDQKEFKEPNPIVKQLKNPFIYISLLLTIVATNSMGFILNSARTNNSLIILFIFILIICFAGFIVSDYFRLTDAEKKHLFIEEDIYFYIGSIIGIGIGAVVFYLLMKKVVSPDDTSFVLSYTIISCAIVVGLLIISKISSYFINKIVLKKKDKTKK